MDDEARKISVRWNRAELRWTMQCPCCYLNIAGHNWKSAMQWAAFHGRRHSRSDA